MDRDRMLQEIEAAFCALSEGMQQQFIRYLESVRSSDRPASGESR